MNRFFTLAAAFALSACAAIPAPTIPAKADAMVLHRLIEAQTAFKSAQQLALSCHSAAVPACVNHWPQIADVNDRGVQLETAAVTAAHAGNSTDIAALTVNFRSLVSQLSALGVPIR